MTINQHEKRHHRRFEVGLPISFTGKEKGLGIVRNLSKCGCQMECKGDIASGECLMLHITLSTDEASLVIQVATVRGCDDGLFNIAFLVMEAKEQERLKVYLSNLEQTDTHKDPQSYCE
jgi:PilZ domain-containing protein